MARLILHIGTSKAGSTAVQEFLAANRGAFAAAGLDYFPALDGPNHSELAAAFCTEPNRPATALGVRTGADRERLRHWLARRITRRLRPDATWLASSEHLSALLVGDQEVAALAAYLRGFFDQVLAVVVLRRADFFLPSSYVESVRAGGTHRLDAAFVARRAPVLDHARTDST